MLKNRHVAICNDSMVRARRAAWVILLCVAPALTQPVEAACVGNCGRDGRVTIDALIRGVGLVLGAPAATSVGRPVDAPLGQDSRDEGDAPRTTAGLGGADAVRECSLDRDGDGAAAMDELITAVGRALNGCPKALAARVVDAAELIGGPMAVGRVGDYC